MEIKKNQSSRGQIKVKVKCRRSKFISIDLHYSLSIIKRDFTLFDLEIEMIKSRVDHHQRSHHHHQYTIDDEHCTKQTKVKGKNRNRNKYDEVYDVMWYPNDYIVIIITF